MWRFLSVVVMVSVAAVGATSRGAEGSGCCGDDAGIRAIVPARLVDTRSGGITVDGLQSSVGPLIAGRRLDVAVAGRGGVPDDAGVVALNVTAIAPTAVAHVTVWPSGAPQPMTSNLNTSPGRTLPNMVVVPLGSDGRVSISISAGSAHLAIDVLAWFPSSGDFTGVVPARLIDTRPHGITIDGREQAGGAVGTDEVITVDVAGRGGVPAGAGAVALNVTAVNPTSWSHLVVWPSLAPRPVASNLNTAPGLTVPNMVIVPVGADGRVALYNAFGDVHVVIDVLGWFAAGGDFTGVVPARVADTRPRGTTIDGLQRSAGALNAGGVLGVAIAGRGGVPLDAGAVVLNVTAVTPTAVGYLTVWPSDQTRPHTSNLNTELGRTLPNLVIVPLGEDGSVSVYNASGSTHVVVDVLGWFGRTRTRLASIHSDGGLANADSRDTDVSADGRFIVFESDASNLVDDDVDGTSDVFVRDMRLSTTEMVSRDSFGAQSMGPDSDPSISADGRYVAMVAGDGTLVVRDRLARTTEVVGLDAGGQPVAGDFAATDISADGRFVAFETSADMGVPGDAPDVVDIFVRDRGAATTTIVTVGYDGAPADEASRFASVSADGRYVAFDSKASNLVAGDTNGARDVFVRDLIAGSTQRVSVDSDGIEAPFESGRPSLSADGRFVAFESDGVFSAADDNWHQTDVYVHDLVGGQTSLVSVDSSGSGGANASELPSISGDGRFVSFNSRSPDLVDGDTDDVVDVFVHDRALGQTRLVSVTLAGSAPTQISYWSSISADGRYVAFVSMSDELVAGAVNGTLDVFECGVRR